MKLTKRQLEVLWMIMIGMPNKQIALELGVSVSAVEGHAESLFKKLNVHCRVRAAVQALKLNIVKLADI